MIQKGLEVRYWQLSFRENKSLIEQGLSQKLREAFMESNLAQCRGGQLNMLSRLMAAGVTNLGALVSHPVAHCCRGGMAWISRPPSRWSTALVGICSCFKHWHLWPAAGFAFPMSYLWLVSVCTLSALSSVWSCACADGCLINAAAINRELPQDGSWSTCTKAVDVGILVRSAVIKWCFSSVGAEWRAVYIFEKGGRMYFDLEYSKYGILQASH